MQRYTNSRKTGNHKTISMSATRLYIKHLFRSTAICLALLTALTGFAQDYNIRVMAPGSVEVGDQFQITFEVNTNKARDFSSPTFKGLSLLGGPSTQTSTNISIMNGRRSTSVTTSYTYVLRADVEGVFNIGAATCTVDGQKIASQPFRLKVEKATGKRRQQQQQDPFAGDPFFDAFFGNDRRQQQQQQQPVTIDASTLFARASVDKSSVYRGQEMIITYRIYTQVPISQFQIDKLPGNKGFWSEDLSQNKKIKQYEETVDGKRYQVAEIRRGALFAQEDGTLRIEPLDLDVLAMVQAQRRRSGTIWDLFDDAFFNPAQAVEKHLKTNSIKVNVKPLPAAPSGFGGGVGKFSVKSRISAQTTKTNEALTYTLTVSGSGNLMLIDEPAPAFPETFEVYDPKVTDNINRTDNGITGSRTYEWILIPRSQGDYTIPTYDFVYFDPASGKYQTASAEEYNIHVDKGSGAQGSAISRNDVKLINNDINHIRTRTHMQERNAAHQGSALFWLLLALPIAAALVAIPVGRGMQQRRQDTVGLRQRHANKLARRRLKRAEEHLRRSNVEEFYTEIYQAVWGVLSDKFGIPKADLNRDSVQQCLEDKAVPEETRNDVLHTLTEVDFARFAPGDQSAKMQEIYNKAFSMISSLE